MGEELDDGVEPQVQGNGQSLAWMGITSDERFATYQQSRSTWLAKKRDDDAERMEAEPGEVNDGLARDLSQMLNEG